MQKSTNVMLTTHLHPCRN